MKLFTIVFLLLAASAASAYFFWYKPKFSHHRPCNTIAVTKNEGHTNEAAILRLKQKAGPLRSYADKNNYSSKHCFLVDMKIQSGRYRFFVYNLEADSIETAGLVTHGSGSGIDAEQLIFSNIPNSNSTSLGKYKVGRSYMGKFGLAYKLHGLDNSNNKAFERFVVLHAHSCVPNEEISPLPICESRGCPTVAPAFLTKLKAYIDTSPHPVLLWIYY